MSASSAAFDRWCTGPVTTISVLSARVAAPASAAQAPASNLGGTLHQGPESPVRQGSLSGDGERRPTDAPLRAASGTYRGSWGCGPFYDRAGWLPDGTEKSEDVGGVPVIDVRYRRPL
jgi:hypothetical protein